MAVTRAEIAAPLARRHWIGEAFARHPTVVVGTLLLLAMVCIALLAPYLGTVDPRAVSPVKRLRPPSELYWFGTDAYGRDVWSRTLFGARVSLQVGLGVAFFSTVVGLGVGLITGFNRLADALISRVMDGLMAVPPVLLAIALMALTKASVGNVVLAITLSEVPRVTRLVRGVVLSLREQPFVEAAVATGTGFFRTLSRHILPNTIAPVLVQATFICASAMITEAVLSFIGAGTPPEIPSWGNIMAEGRTYFQIKPYLIIFPGVFLSVTVLAVNLVGDGLRDALDPRLARRM
jgi:peptide/nickel transport system permease protein